MKGLATILRETDVKQVIGTLADFNIDGSLKGKCALGVISCEVGLILGHDRSKWSSWTDILRKAGVPEDLRTVGVLSYGEVGDADSLHNYIVYLNDDMCLSFKEIADWIETTFPEEEWAK